MRTRNVWRPRPPFRACLTGRARAALLALCLAPWFVSYAPAAPAAEAARAIPAGPAAVRLSFAPVVKKASPAVVSITSKKRLPDQRSALLDDPLFRFFMRGAPGPDAPQVREQTALGSGVIVRGDGLIVTNNHVVEGADEITAVLADRRAFKARLLSTAPRSALAFLKVDAGRVPALPLGDSDTIEVGDLVLAIGNPFGIGQTVTSGIVSAGARATPIEGGAGDVAFIQTDAAINPGNSGGALVSLDGELLGINTAIFTRSGGSIGIGFAIPANLVKARLATLDAGGTPVRPWPGLDLREVDGDLAQTLGLDRPEGVAVAGVNPKGSAAAAGVRKGDVILAVDGVAVQDVPSFNYRLSLKPLGAAAALDLVRAGRRHRLDLPIRAAPKEPPPDATTLGGRQPLAGATVANLSPGLAEELGRDPDESGVVVLEVEGAARAYGLRPGDVILALDDARIGSVADLRQALRGWREWRLVIRREGRVLAVRLG